METETTTILKSRRRLGDKITLIVLALVFILAFYVALDANKYRAMVRVIDGAGKVGVNPTDLALDFGDLSRATAAVRRVALKNSSFLPVYVVVWKTGELRSLLKVDRSSFRLPPGEETKIEFSTYIPASAEIGREYSGRVFIFKIPSW